MLAQALTASSDMHKENSRILALIEDKAQKAAGLAGALLGAAFAFLKKDALQDIWNLSGWFGLLLLAAIMIIMLACVLASTHVLGIREMITPPDPAAILHHVDIYLSSATDSPSDASRENNLRDQIRKWNEAIDHQHQAITYKSGWLLVTQRT